MSNAILIIKIKILLTNQYSNINCMQKIKLKITHNNNNRLYSTNINHEEST